jgi:hypothetical protein
MNQRLKHAGAALAGIVATLAAGGIAFASIDHRPAPFRDADGNHDGQITRAEWMAAATTRFDRLDTDKDGKLVPDELPRPHGHHGHHGPRGGWDRDGDGPRGDWDRDGPPPPPLPGAAPQQPPAAPAAPAAASSSATPQK